MKVTDCQSALSSCWVSLCITVSCVHCQGMLCQKCTYLEKKKNEDKKSKPAADSFPAGNFDKALFSLPALSSLSALRLLGFILFGQKCPPIFWHH